MDHKKSVTFIKLISYFYKISLQAMPPIDQLRVGQRYLFYEKGSVYRGKFLELRSIQTNFPSSGLIRYIYIACDHRINGKRIMKIISIDQIQVLAETLIDTFQGKIGLPDDLLNVIDEFL
jgi:hypothetical protein